MAKVDSMKKPTALMKEAEFFTLQNTQSCPDLKVVEQRTSDLNVEEVIDL